MRIEDIDRPVLLDANIILNASFLPGGECDRALGILAAKGKAFQVEDTTWSECANRLRAILRNEELARGAINYMIDRMARLSVLQVPPVLPPAAERRHDRHIIALAAQRGLVVLTTDNELHVRLLRKGLRVIVPDGPEFWDHPSRPPPNWVAEGERDDFRELLILVWALPGGWAGRATGRHTLFSADGWGSLSFDNTNKPAIRFDSVCGKELIAPHRLASNQPMVAAVTTHFSIVDLKAAKSRIYVSSGPKNSTSNTVAFRLPFLPSRGAKWLGSSRGETEFWNGHIRSFNIRGRWLSPRIWKQITEIQDFRPSFCTDVGKLEAAVRATFGSPIVRP
jgi:predicted nucleic acid-binding protein